MNEGYDVEDATWVDATRLGSKYEEQLDTSRENGKWRHRLRESGDRPHRPWVEGRAPIAEQP